MEMTHLYLHMLLKDTNYAPAKDKRAPSKNLFKDKNAADKHFRDTCPTPFPVFEILGHNTLVIKINT